MTKTQQKLARQATIFVNFGGRALTALLRIVLLSIAAVFEAVSRVFLFLEVALERDAVEMDRARKRTGVRSFTLAIPPDGEGRRLGDYARESAPALTGTAGKLARRK